MSFRIESQAEPIPGYRLLSRLGGGGYGDVWKCEAPGGVYKAIKFVFGNLESVNAIGDEDESGRAEQELRSLERIKRIRHPFILALDRYEIVNGQLMIISELADCSLHDRARECLSLGLPGIPREELLSYMLETAEALDYMTEKHDLLHLDVKPQNLFLLCNHIKIGDFGLVKDVEGLLASVTGGFTTIYAAPESFEGYVSRYSDQYSLAIVYQELLTGVRPYPGTNARQIMLQHIQGKPNLEALPECEREVIARALSKTPTDRWPNCMAMIKALQNAKQLEKEHTRQTESALQRDMATVPVHPPARIVPEPDVAPLLDVDGTFTDNNQDTPKADPAFIRSSKQRASRPLRKPTKAATANHTQAKAQDPSVKADSQKGVLRPSLIIGLGQFGRAALNQMRKEMTRQLGSVEFPLIRTWTIDTDEAPLAPRFGHIKGSEELLVTGLSRPARYIRSRDTLPPVEDWLDSSILYRMPRTLQTNGIRALGRLAFIEHYSAFTARLERELQELMKSRAHLEACKLLNCSMRNTQPQVFVVTHLGGGTGSGMFLDCAYVTRHIMRKLKIANPDVTGVFFIPDSHAMESPDLAEANAVAALHELYHYQHTDSPFKALYYSKMEPLTDASSPFNQCLFFETPQRSPAGKENRHDPARPVMNQAASCLMELCVSAVGRLVESHRQAVPDQTSYQAIGLKAVTSPKTPLLKVASRLVFNQLMDYWARPTPSEQYPFIQKSVDQIFITDDYYSEGMVKHLEQFLATTLEKNPDQFIRDLIEPFKRPVREYLPTSGEVQKALDKILDMLGTGQEDESVSLSILNPVTQWSRILRDACRQKLRSIKARIKQAIFPLLDRPGLRLGASEVAHHYLVQVLDKFVNYHTELAKSSQHDFAQALSYLREDALEYDRIRSMAKFRWPKMQTPGERLLAAYRARYQALLHERLVNFYEVIRNMCSDIEQEIYQCRSRFLELQHNQKSIQNSIELRDTIDDFTRSFFLPEGFTDLLQAAQQISAAVSPQDMDQIDVTLSDKLTRVFPKLAEFSQNSAEALSQVRDLIQAELFTILEQRTPMNDAVAAFLEKEHDLPQALESLYHEAAPPVVLNNSANAHELVVILIPDTPKGKALEQKILNTLPDLNVVTTTMLDEVVMYRAVHGFELDELSVFNEAGHHAYHTALQIEHFTPHSRQDVTEWCNPLVESKSGVHEAVDPA